jgi:hypothetical protein
MLVQTLRTTWEHIDESIVQAMRYRVLEST